MDVETTGVLFRLPTSLMRAALFAMIEIGDRMIPSRAHTISWRPAPPSHTSSVEYREMVCPDPDGRGSRS